MGLDHAQKIRCCRLCTALYLLFIIVVCHTQLYLSVCSITHLDNGVYGASLLAVPAENTLCHVNVVSASTAKSKAGSPQEKRSGRL